MANSRRASATVTISGKRCVLGGLIKLTSARVCATHAYGKTEGHISRV